jgi:orotidine-5'-phosphate decarboxylase
MINLFSKEKIISLGHFEYANGGSGPYYVDMRKIPNNPSLQLEIIKEYTKILSESDKHLFIGVPVTGTIFSTGLARRMHQPLAIIEKNDHKKIHIFTYEDQQKIMTKYIQSLDPTVDIKHTIFLGLEDIGTLFSTALGIHFNIPSAILRRKRKSYGTCSLIEADLSNFLYKGYKNIYIINDLFNPLSEDYLLSCVMSEVKRFTSIKIITLNKDEIEYSKDLGIEHFWEYKLSVIEDLWTTGGSSINIYNSIKKQFNREADIYVLLDREQGAEKRLGKYGINGRSVYKIRDLLKKSYLNGYIEDELYDNVLKYVNQFNREKYISKLENRNSTNLCVGIDIAISKLPQSILQSSLPNVPYRKTLNGLKHYCCDLLDEIGKTDITFVKPNFAYYAGFDYTEILETIQVKAKELGLTIILDSKIGDISRTQQQYVQHFHEFDAITVNPYMGYDVIKPLVDFNIGVYVLVFTSNPGRDDLQNLICEDGNPFYYKVAEKVVDWNLANDGSESSIGAVIGGTGEDLVEMKQIITLFVNKLGYLPPILIPGVGTQGGSIDKIISTFRSVFEEVGWNEDKIKKEFTKVLINSSSQIDYAFDPEKKIREITQEIEDKKETSNSPSNS